MINMRHLVWCWKRAMSLSNLIPDALLLSRGATCATFWKQVESCNQIHNRLMSRSAGTKLTTADDKRDRLTSDSSTKASQNPVTLQGNCQSFDNYKVAYGSKSNWKLVMALIFFFLCRSTYVTENAVQLMELCYKIFGKRAADVLIRKTIYEQFVAGDSTHAIKEAIAQLSRGGVSSILCVPIESDAHVNKRQSHQEQFFDESLEKILGSITLSMQLRDSIPMVQFRITAVVSGDLLKDISRFCESTHNVDVMNSLIAGMKGAPVEFDKLLGWSQFPRERSEDLQRGLERLGAIMDALRQIDIIALVDAEYTYLNPAMRQLTLCMMKICNSERAKIFYTYQAYLKTSKSILEQDLSFAQTNGFALGVKLVRGAYMVKERQLSRSLGYPDPVNETFDLTTASYHSCLDILLTKVATEKSVRFIIASHNEDTIRYAMRRMDELGIPRDGSNVFFGQLYGMADHVSFTLGQDGYRVYKSIPYGPIAETLPYLARRAQENQAILLNARRERQLIGQTLKDRLMFRRG